MGAPPVSAADWQRDEPQRVTTRAAPGVGPLVADHDCRHQSAGCGPATSAGNDVCTRATIKASERRRNHLPMPQPSTPTLEREIIPAAFGVALLIVFEILLLLVRTLIVRVFL